jgi:RNA polymerase sigma-70 factor (ECF subfamily)
MEQNEDALLAKLVTDLRGHFTQLVLGYQTRLYAFAYRLCRSRQEAEDIVQEAFIGAYVALENYTPERIQTLKLQSWLYRITLNTYYHHTRKARLQLVPLIMDEEGSEQSFEDDEHEQPEALFEVKERRQELEALVMTLPERYRVALTCYFFEQLSYQEIAELLEQPLGTVKSNVSRGLRLLRTHITQSGEQSKGYAVWNTNHSLTSEKGRKSRISHNGQI